MSLTPPDAQVAEEVDSIAFQEAQKLFEYGRFQEAIELWETIPPIHPRYVDAQLAIRESRLRIQNIAEDQTDDAQRALRIEDIIAEAERFEHQGELAEAVAKYEEAYRLDPKNPRLFNKIEEIHSLLEDALERHRSLGELYFAQGHYEKSKEEWERLLLLEPDNEQARQRLADIEVLTATTDTVFYQRGKRLFDQGLIHAAKTEFEKARRVNPTNLRTLEYLKQLEEFPYTEYVVKQGDTLSTIARSYTGHSSDYKILVDFNQLDETVPLKVGQILKIPHILRFKDALAPKADQIRLEEVDTEPAPSPNPNTSTERAAPQQSEQNETALEKMFEQGVQAFEAGNYREAVKLFQEVYQQNPDNQDAYDYFTQAVARVKQGTDTIEPVSGPPDDGGALQSDLQQMIEAGLSYRNTGELKKALAVFEQASQLAPDNTKIRTYLEETRDEFKKLITAYLNEGIKLFNQEALREAILVWNKVLELDPTNQQALNYKARAETILNAFTP